MECPFSRRTISLFAIMALMAISLTACKGSSHGSSTSESDSVAPVIASANSVGFAEGTAGTFTVTVTGNPVPSITISGTLPTGVSFDTSTGILSGTPAAGSAGSYPLTITVANGVGSTVSQSFTLTVSGPPSWRTAVRLDTDTGDNDALEAQIAGNGSGNFVAVWRQGDGSGVTRIWASVYSSATQSWAVAEEIETSTFNSQEPQVTMDSAGNAVAIWTRGAAVNNHMWSSSYDATTGTWGAAVKIEADDAGNSTQPHLGMNAMGRAVCVWVQDNTDLWANIYDPATKTWGVEETVDGIPEPAFQPQVAVDGSGNAVIVFIQQVGGGAIYNIMSNNYNISTHTWGAAALVETVDLGNALQPRIGMDSTGDAVAVWQQHDGSRYDIWTNTFNATTKTWGAAAKIETLDEDVSYQQLAVNAAGDAVAVWCCLDAVTSRNKVYANIYHKATGWGTATRIEADSTATSNNLMDPQVSIDASGNAVAVWTWYNQSIRANVYDVGNHSWSAAAQTVGSGGTIDEFTWPQVAIDDSGRAMCVWARNTVRANIRR